MPRTLVIGLVGFSGVGKGIFCKIAEDIYGITTISTGDIIRNETIARGFGLTYENIQMVAKMIEEETQGHFMRLIQSYIEQKSKGNKAIVIDSLRTKLDLQILSEYTNNRLVTVAIIASPWLRYLRLKARSREGDPQNYTEFEDLCKREIEFGMPLLIKRANYCVENNGSEEEFKVASEKLLKEIINVRKNEVYYRKN